MKRVEIRLLGGFVVSVDGTPVAAGAFAHRRAADLVKLLALAPAQRMPRDAVVEALWPHLGADAGVANLHKAAHHARRALGAQGAVVLRGGLVELAPAAVVVTDVARFEAGDDDAYGGDLLPDDRYVTWTLEARERLRARRLDLLRRHGRWSDLVREDPADERAQRELMRAHAAGGDAAAVIRQYRLLTQALAELGLQPGEQTAALLRDLTSGPPVQAAIAPHGPLIGRARELAAASRALSAADEGRGGALLITGDPGIGKTRVVDALHALAAERGRHVLRATAHPATGHSPYGLVGEAVEPLAAARADLLAEPVRHVLDLLGPAGTATGGTARGPEVVAAVARLLLTAAREHGLVVILEDLHLADAASLRMLAYLAAAARRERMLLVLSARADEGGEPLAQLHATLLEHSAAADLRLDGLAAGALRQLVLRAARRPLADETVEAVVAMAAGNPFFAEELAAAAEATAGARLPGRLATLLDARIARLAAATPEPVVDALAVLDEGSSSEEIAAVAGTDVGRAGAALSAGVATGVLARDGHGWRFRHPLLRDAARRRIPAARLAAAHRSVAALLQQRGASPERIAIHLIDGDRAADAVPLLRAAASRAAELGAYADGAYWVERALPHAATEERPRLLELLGDLRRGTGDRRAAAAYTAARAAGDPDATPRLALKEAHAHMAFADLAAAEALLRGAAGDHDHEREALLLRGVIAWYRGDFATARAHRDDADRYPGPSDGSDEIAYNLDAMLGHAEGRWDRTMEAMLTEVWHVPQLAGRVLDAYLCVTEYVLHAGDPAASLTAFARDLYDQAQRAGARRGVAFAATLLGEARMLGGDPETARAHLAEAARLSRELHAVGGEALARARLAEALHLTRHTLAARAELGEALDLALTSSLADHLLFLVHGPLVRVAADGEEALTLVDRAEALLDPQPRCRFCPIEYYVAAAIACARAGDPDRGRGFLARAEGSAALWAGGPRWASVAEARGELLAAEGKPTEAQVAFLRAADGFAAVGHRLHEARVRERLAVLA